MLPATVLPLAPTTACSRAPGVPLRSASLWPRRARFLSLLPITDEIELRDFLLSRIDLPMRMLSVLLVPTVALRVADFREAEIDGVLLIVEPIARDVRPSDLAMIDTLPELAAGCLAAEEAGSLYMLIVLLFRDVLPESIRLLELAIDRLAYAEMDGLLAVIELPILDLVLVVGCLVEEPTDGLVIVIELPMRALLLGLRRILELRLTEVESVVLRLTEVVDESPREIEELGRLE